MPQRFPDQFGASAKEPDTKSYEHICIATSTNASFAITARSIPPATYAPSTPNASSHILALEKVHCLSLPAGFSKAALTAILLIIGTAMCLVTGTSIPDVIDGFSFSVLVVLIAMELFTNMLASTGIMEMIAVRLAVLSQGRCMMLVALLCTLMFLVSSILNNITAILVILPCVFVLLRTLELDRRYSTVLFAAVLAMSNLGGASTGVGDLPAVMIVQSGVVSFAEYTLVAFPFFSASAMVLVGFWLLVIVGKRRSTKNRDRFGDHEASASFAVAVLQSQYAHIDVDRKTLTPLIVILGVMIAAWMAVPTSIMPSDMIAVLGCVCTIALFRIRNGTLTQVVDMGSVLTIASFLFIAACISATGALDSIANALHSAFPDSRAYLASVLALSSLLSGLVGAGPAAACCLPIVCELATTTFAANSTVVMVAYGAAICAGSSLFLWSATAGFILTEKIEASGVNDHRGQPLTFGIKDYLGYGLINYSIQFVLVLALAAVSI